MKEESVWDYPRPPHLELFNGHLRIIHSGKILADSNGVKRILETSHPPTYYIPSSDVDWTYLKISSNTTYCEFKGMASYVDYVGPEGIIQNIGWFYQKPNKSYGDLEDHIAFYASKLDECLLNDEKVTSQEGDFYGGWITSNIKGPFKGGPGTYGW